jgi:hypothetical protein
MNEERDAIAKLIAQKIDASINKGGGIWC